jgi:glycosyltransferase involved in cell wall biosynthesis
MRIGVNTGLVGTTGGYRRTGVSRYISELLEALPGVLGPGDRIETMAPEHERFRSPVGRILWEQTVLPMLASRRSIEVLHSPVNVVPLAWLGPQVVTVHDLAFVRHPDHLTPRRRAWLTSAVRLSARRADRVIAVSTSTADDLVDWLDLPRSRIDVVPSAPSPHIRPVEGAALDDFRETHRITRPFVLSVGTLEPRKNLPTLLRAFAAIRDRVPHDLVLVGPEGWLTAELRRTIEELELGSRLRMTGFVPDDELGAWYSAADLFAFPSFYEGFGLPAVEAMHCGTPVLASSTSCFPEVVGDAGQLADPEDVQGWAEALSSLLGDPQALTDLGRRGRERAAGFTWTRTATLTRASYDGALRDHRSRRHP